MNAVSIASNGLLCLSMDKKKKISLGICRVNTQYYHIE